MSQPLPAHLLFLLSPYMVEKNTLFLLIRNSYFIINTTNSTILDLDCISWLLSILYLNTYWRVWFDLFPSIQNFLGCIWLHICHCCQAIIRFPGISRYWLYLGQGSKSEAIRLNLEGKATGLPRAPCTFSWAVSREVSLKASWCIGHHDYYESICFHNTSFFRTQIRQGIPTDPMKTFQVIGNLKSTNKNLIYLPCVF